MILSTQPSVRSRMLFARHGAGRVYPFSAASTHSFFYARNSLWHAAQFFQLAGKEVLVPSYHHGVEIDALVYAGAIPVYYRVDAKMKVDLEDVKKKIGPKTGALYLIHYLGFPGPTAEFRRLADARKLRLIEDCALALLSSDGPTPLGSIGDASIFCLYKTLPLPHGGVLAFNRDAPAGALLTESPPLDSTLSHFAASFLLANPEFKRLGKKLHRLLQPAGKALFSTGERVNPGEGAFEPRHLHLGMSRLVRRLINGLNMEEIKTLRRRNFLILLKELRRAAPLVFDRLPDGVCPLFYPLVVPDKDAFREEMRRREIETVDFWRLTHPTCPTDNYPEAARLRESVMELPCHQDLSEEMVMRVAREAKDVLHRITSKGRSFSGAGKSIVEPVEA